MFCFGDKESWYKQLVPSGMLPAIQIDGLTISESDDIIYALENVYGPLNGQSMENKDVLAMRNLERQLFSVWCKWLC